MGLASFLYMPFCCGFTRSKLHARFISVKLIFQGLITCPAPSGEFAMPFSRFQDEFLFRFENSKLHARFITKTYELISLKWSQA
jgi:hypothetical protein